jgi:hypothetical protein
VLRLTLIAIVSLSASIVVRIGSCSGSIGKKSSRGALSFSPIGVFLT